MADKKSTTEIDFIYLISNKLIDAVTPQQQLEAVSDYARFRGASQSVLFYTENPELDPELWMQVSAFWLADDKDHLGISLGDRLETTRFQFFRSLLTRPYQPTLIPNINEQNDLDPPLLTLFTADHMQATAILPLHNSGRFLGLLWFNWDRPHKFTQQDSHIYTAILQQLAPLIDSHHLLAQRYQRTIELENAYQELDVLYQTGELINRANTYEEVVEAVAPIDTDADAVSLMLWETLDWETSNRLNIVVHIDRTGNRVLKAGDYILKDDFPVTRVMLGQQVWDFENTQTDPRTDSLTRASWKSLNVLSFFGTALYIDNRWLGGIAFYSDRPRNYTGQQKRLLAGIGEMVLGAIERIRLRIESEKSMQTYVVLEERNRLARELHDSVSQAVYGIVLSLKTMQLQLDRTPDQVKSSLDYALSLSQAALSEMRALIFELRPETLEKEGLIEALTRQVEMIQARYSLFVESNMIPEPQISLEIKEHVYWIAREILHNIVKHARATHVDLFLACDDKYLSLKIIDNGIGFDPSHDFAGHLGLKSMQERTTRLKGTLTISSNPQNGTSIHLQAPIQL